MSSMQSSGNGSQRKRSPDGRVEQIARLAVSVAKKNLITPLAAFNQTRPKPKPMSVWDTIGHSPIELGELVEKKEPENAEVTLRCNLEAALLRLEAHHWPPNVPRTSWPTDGDFKALESLVFKAARTLLKRLPADGWPAFQRVDRRFPKLELCARLSALVDSVVKLVPPRPLAVLLPPLGKLMDEQTKRFLKALYKMGREQGDPAEIDWTLFEPVLTRYKIAHGKKKSKARAPSGAPEILARLDVLEVERAEKEWVRLHQKKLSPVRAWMTRVAAPKELWSKLAPFFDAGITAESAAAILKKKQAAARQAKRKLRNRENSVSG